MSECCCQGCNDRTKTCHSTCVLYLDFKKQSDALRDLKHKEKARNRASYTAICKNHFPTRKFNHKEQ